MKIPFSTLVTALSSHFEAEGVTIDPAKITIVMSVGERMAVRASGDGECDVVNIGDADERLEGVRLTISHWSDESDEEFDEEEDSDSDGFDSSEDPNAGAAALIAQCAALTADGPMSPAQMAKALDVDVKVIAKALNVCGESTMSIVGPTVEDGTQRWLWMAHGTEAFTAAVEAAKAVKDAGVAHYRAAVIGTIQVAGKIRRSALLEAMTADMTDENERALFTALHRDILSTLRDEGILFRRTSGKWMIHKAANLSPA